MKIIMDLGLADTQNQMTYSQGENCDRDIPHRNLLLHYMNLKG